MLYPSRTMIIMTNVATIDLPMRLTIIITVVMRAFGTMIATLIIILITTVIAIITIGTTISIVTHLQSGCWLKSDTFVDPRQFPKQHLAVTIRTGAPI